MAVSHDLSLSLKAKFFRGLADTSRLARLEALRGGEKTVSELVTLTGLSQPNVSHHPAWWPAARRAASSTTRWPTRGSGRFCAPPRASLADIATQVYACARYEA